MKTKETECKLFVPYTTLSTDRCLVCGRLKWEHEPKQNK